MKSKEENLPAPVAQGWTSLMLVALAMLVFALVKNVEAADDRGDLILLLGGFSHTEGQAVVKLFRKEDDLFGKAYKIEKNFIWQNQSIVKFKNLPYGDYAVILYHDENANGTVDHNIFNLPKEPLGFSNGFQLTLFSGMPTFLKLKFHFGKKQMRYRINVR